MYSTAICYNSLILQILYRVILKHKRRVLTNFYRLEQNLLMLIIMLLMKSKKRWFFFILVIKLLNMTFAITHACIHTLLLNTKQGMCSIDCDVGAMRVKTTLIQTLVASPFLNWASQSYVGRISLIAKLLFLYFLINLIFHCLQSDNLESEKASLYELWERRKIELDQSLELQLFYRDCQNAENQMAKQEVL